VTWRTFPRITLRRLPSTIGRSRQESPTQHVVTAQRQHDQDAAAGDQVASPTLAGMPIWIEISAAVRDGNGNH
jgi:hypothetical protein